MSDARHLAPDVVLGPEPSRRATAPELRLRGQSTARSERQLAHSLIRALEHRRLLVLVPFALVTGVVTSLAGSQQPEPAVLLLVGMGILLALALSLTSLRRLRLLLLVGAFWLGFALLSLHATLFGTGMLGWPAHGSYRARVDAVLSEADDRVRLLISAIEAQPGSPSLPVRRARIVAAAGVELAPGDLIESDIRFYPVPAPVVPGGFDSQFHAFFDGIGAYGSATGQIAVLVRGRAAADRLIDSIRRGIGARIERSLAAPASGIARALFTGDQSHVGETERSLVAAAGLAHVLSISGLHLTLVAGGVFAVLRALLSLSHGLAQRLAVKPLAAIGGIAAALLYLSVSGGSIAAWRATLMIVLVFGAVVFGRRALTMRNVALAAIIVIAMDPASVLRPSFQLSFSAVVALVGAWELMRPRDPRPRGIAGRLLSYVFGLAATSLVAGGATLLFSIYHFQQTAPLGVLGNLLALPLVAFVMMPSGVIAGIAMPLGWEAAPLWVMGWSIDRMLDIASLVVALSGHLEGSPLLTPLALLIGAGGLAWFAFLTDRWRLLGPAVVMVTVPLLAFDHAPDVLISDSTRAIAVRGETGLELVAGSATSFAVDVWREHYMADLPPVGIGCDGIACVGEGAAGFRYAIVFDPAGFAEECTADLVITRRLAPRSCPAATVIDAAALRGGGAHWLRWDAESRRFEIRRAVVDLNRPWRVAR